MAIKSSMPGLVITGGSRGIGAATAILAAERGYGVCVNYVSDELAATAVVDEIRAKGGQAISVKADIRVEREVSSLFHAALKRFGSVVALVNNAGVTGRIGRFERADIEMLRTVVDTNLMGTMLCTQEALRHMLPLQYGVIVNLSSVAATTGAANEYVHYAASKAAVDAFTLGLAKEVADQGIRINAVAPGSTLTDIHTTAGEPNRPARVKDRIPMRRLAEPSEIAKSILWLLSDEASYITGTVLRVSGGF